MTDYIELTALTPQIRVKRANVYFTFASGRLTYDCVTCGAKCCHGHGFNMELGSELCHQVTANPTVQLFMQPCDKQVRHVHVKNYPPGCFFLTPENRCGIQTTRGYGAKPATCRLFPFNQLVYADGFLLVAPHNGLCPIDVCEPGADSPASNHQDLFVEMSRTGVSETVSLCKVHHANIASTIALERQIVELSESAECRGHFVSFAATQLVASRNTFAARAGSREADAASEIRCFMNAICDVLGIHVASDADRRLANLFAAIGPTMRARLLFGAAGFAVGLAPFWLAALYVLSAMARDAGQKKVTYMTVSRLVMDYGPLLRMLAYLNTAPVWRADASVNLNIKGSDAMRSSYIRVAKALLPKEQEGQSKTLALILRESLDVTGIDRIAILNALATALDGAIHSPRDDVRVGGPRHRLKASVNRWALARLPSRLLVAASRS